MIQSQLGFTFTKVQIAGSTVVTSSDWLPLVRIRWLGRWGLWGWQSIGNCLFGGCCQKPQWVVGIDGGGIEDADCRTFLAPAMPWLLYVGPCPPDIHRLLPASPHTPPGLRHPHKAQQAAPSVQNILSSGCAKQQIPVRHGTKMCWRCASLWYGSENTLV